MFDGRLRSQVDAAVKPIGNSIRKSGISADMITTVGIVMAFAAAIAISAGALRLGFLLLVLTGIPDLLDGAVAKASGTASTRGAFFDSVADRFTDALLFGGVAWYLATTQPGRLAVLPMAVLGASMLISYERAKAESLGFDARGGLMERAERIIALALGLLFSQFLIPILWVMLAGTALTAVTRFMKVWNQATASVPTLAERSMDRPRTRVRNRQDRRVARSTTRQVRRRTQLRPHR